MQMATPHLQPHVQRYLDYFLIDEPERYETTCISKQLERIKQAFQNEHSKIRYFHGPFQCYQTICHVNSHLFYLTAKINFQIMQLIFFSSLNINC